MYVMLSYCVGIFFLGAVFASIDSIHNSRPIENKPGPVFAFDSLLI